MKSLLFIVLKSPFISDAVENINMFSGDAEKGVILFEDGVYFAATNIKRKEMIDINIKIYAIKDDLAARGYPEFSEEGVVVVDYDGAVDLMMEKYDSVITIWGEKYG